MVFAVITIGGKGTRFNSTIPKQFVEVNEKPIFVYTLEKFQNNENIDKIVLACLKGYEEKVLEYKEKYGITKLEYIVEGGKTQAESISNCIDKLSEFASEDDIIMVHAGNRPLVENRIINEGIDICKEKGNSVSYIECPEVLVTKDTNELVERTNVVRLQTPQTFKYDDISKAYNLAKNVGFDDIATTADLMLKNGEELNFYRGSDFNFKITYKEDLEIFKNLLYR